MKKALAVFSLLTVLSAPAMAAPRGTLPPPSFPRYISNPPSQIGGTKRTGGHFMLASTL